MKWINFIFVLFQKPVLLKYLFRLKKINNFQDVIEFLNQIPYINNGGCGIAAYSLCRVLKDSKVEIFYLYDSQHHDLYVKNKTNLRNIQKADAATHICIKYKNTYYDSNGPISIENYPLKHKVSVNFLKTAIQTPTIWNRQFNRTFVFLIQKTLKLNLCIPF